jgi:hypothetical protein
MVPGEGHADACQNLSEISGLVWPPTSLLYHRSGPPAMTPERCASLPWASLVPHTLPAATPASPSGHVVGTPLPVCRRRRSGYVLALPWLEARFYAGASFEN